MSDKAISLGEAMVDLTNAERWGGTNNAAKRLVGAAKVMPVDIALEALVHMYAVSISRVRTCEAALAAIHDLSRDND